MNEQQLQQYEEKLLSEKRRLLEEIEYKSEHHTDYGSDIDGYDEETDEAEEFANDLGAITMLKQRVNEIDEAINSIRSGNYGVCTSCGNEIETEVLDEVPESRLCRSCKTKQAN